MADRKQKKSYPHLKALIKNSLTALVVIFVVYGFVNAGSLTPSASPAATMNSLADIAGSGFNTATHSLKSIYDWLDTNVGGVKASLTGIHDASGVSANASGNVMEQLKFIQQNLGGYTYGSSNAGEVLTTAGGTYNAVNLIPSNVRTGVAFGVSSTGTYGGGSLTYGSEDANEVLTTADIPGTYDASNLSAATVKNGTSFGVGLTGDYPSATNPLAGDTGATDATAGTICTGEEGWSKAGALITGTLSVAADSIGVGNTVCGTDGTLLADLFSGTGQGFTGGSQADGGIDDYNNGGSPATGRYETTWTACNVGNNYCGTGDSGADARDDSANLIWSLPCNGSGCSSFSDASPISYTWDNSGGDNNSLTASELCTSGAHGSSGWYLPHHKQLLQAYIDGSWGNLVSGFLSYWSATTRSTNTDNAWVVYLSLGFIYNNPKSNSEYVRCVRPAG
jgi:hypothetical protein